MSLVDILRKRYVELTQEMQTVIAAVISDDENAIHILQTHLHSFEELEREFTKLLKVFENDEDGKAKVLRLLASIRKAKAGIQDLIDQIDP